MAELSYNCNVSQGFNFQNDAQTLVGHIVSCQVGDEAFESDLQVQDPRGNLMNLSVFSASYRGSTGAEVMRILSSFPVRFQMPTR